MNNQAALVIATAVATVAVVLLSINAVVGRMYLRQRLLVCESTLGKAAFALSIVALFSGALTPAFALLAVVMGAVATWRSGDGHQGRGRLSPIFSLPRPHEGVVPELLARTAALNGAGLLLVAGIVWLGIFFAPPA